MNDEQRMLADMASNLFASLGTSATIETSWSDISDLALDGLLLTEEQGGFGGSWEDALIVFRLAGYNALQLPVVEAVVAASLAGRNDGRGTIASSANGTMDGDRFTGTIGGICFGKGSSFIVAPYPTGGSMVIETAALALEDQTSVAGEAREHATCENVPVTCIEADVFAIGALARVAQIAGAMDAALAKSVGYANDRQQFGRPLGKFQAVQQNLATFACEAAAANCAAMGAFQAMARGSAPFETAAAKLRANRAIGIGTALAHQVHGAIGFTIEYDLHPLTRRLWAWRSEFGSDAYWSGVLGAQVVARGADNFWADITALDG
ncbi:acyl-CoA dehydrogenase family protein [Novosphingobium sp. AAP83]|uniref:acyl-CoA dehydrogenase family protein n=1 Tax=Novosphingobium sp. AAP83 TaxID=1523425 RepID=UPI0006B931CC|nr:acyl-CoA dehydrogenase family protein [Novosphingobium sp. AAP83]